MGVSAQTEEEKKASPYNRIHIRRAIGGAITNVPPYLVELIGVGIFGEERHDHDAAGLESPPGRSRTVLLSQVGSVMVEMTKRSVLHIAANSGYSLEDLPWMIQEVDGVGHDNGVETPVVLTTIAAREQHFEFVAVQSLVVDHPVQIQHDRFRDARVVLHR